MGIFIITFAVAVYALATGLILSKRRNLKGFVRFFYVAGVYALIEVIFGILLRFIYGV